MSLSQLLKKAVWGRLFRSLLFVAIVFGLIYRFWLAPVEVTAHRIIRGEIVVTVMGTGTLEAQIKDTVSSKISGRIAEVLVDQGHRVKKGQLLVRLDDEELRQQVAIAQANRESRLAGLSRLQADKTRALAIFTQAKTYHARIQALVERNATTREDLEKSNELLTVAQADLSRSEAAITEGEKELIAADNTLEYHKTRLADTAITAPFEGLIVRRQRDPGDVVVPGTSILTLISTDQLWISAWVDETEMAGLATDQSAKVLFRSEPGRSYAGNVVRLGREADRETREFVVDVNVQELPKNWAVGQRAEVYIETLRKSTAVLLPIKYLVQEDGHSGVFINHQGRAAWRPVTPGLRSADLVEIDDGLLPGETVVLPVDSRNRLSAGQRIAIP